MFCAPTFTLDPRAPSTTAGSKTGEGKSAISSRVCEATSGRKASTKALASAGVLYIFQLAAIRAFLDILCGFLDSILRDGFGRPSDDRHNLLLRQKTSAKRATRSASDA